MITQNHKEIRSKIERDVEKEKSIKPEKFGQRGDHPTRTAPFLHCHVLWRSRSTGILNRNSLEPKGLSQKA